MGRHSAVIAAGVSASKNRAKAGYQFPRIERLREIIIRTDFKRDDPVYFFALRGYDDNRDLRFGAYSPKQLKTAEPGQHDIQYRDGVITRECPVKPLFAIVDCL